MSRQFVSPLTEPAPLAPRIAVLVPCYNEAARSRPSCADFAARAADGDDLRLRQQLHATIRENGAAAAGAIVRTETAQGKGNVVRRMFADIEAEVYVLVDGDGTYDAPSAAAWCDMLLDELARHGQRRARRDDRARVPARPRRSATSC